MIKDLYLNIGTVNTYYNFRSVNFNEVEVLNLVSAIYINDIPEQFSNLKKLIINKTPIKFLPKYLNELESLIISENNFIPEIPDNFVNMKEIRLFKANNIQEIPETFTKLEKLIIIDSKYFNENMIEDLKKSFPNLKRIEIDKKFI